MIRIIPDITSKYARYRLRDPHQFDKLRTKDVGRKGHTKLILGRLRGKNVWKVQAVLISIADYKKGTRVKMMGEKPVIVN